MKERSMRFKTFVENVNQIFEEAKDHPHAHFGITKFADWTKGEKAMLTGTRPVIERNMTSRKSFVKHSLPSSFDWRSRNMVTPVKDQGRKDSIADIDMHCHGPLFQGRFLEVLSRGTLPGPLCRGSSVMNLSGWHPNHPR